MADDKIHLGWLDAVPADAPVLVIGGGFFMYLSEQETVALMRRILSTFPAGEFIFDAYNGAMLWLVSRLPTVKNAVVTLRWAVSDLPTLEQQVSGLQLVEAQPFFCLPELARLGLRSKTMGRTPLRSLVRHLRYRF